jgi:peptide/nickel transport system substrate-binding protein
VAIRRQVMAAVAVAGIVFGACSSGATPAPTQAPATPAATTAPASAVTSAAPSGTPLTGVDAAVFGTKYNPGPGQPGGTLVMGEWQAADQLNPYYTTSEADVEAYLPALRGCATISSDGKYIPDLCASLPSESNGGIVVNGNTFTITLKLKPNLQWSDGQPLTMNDLKYTWQWANDPNQSGCTSCGPGTAWPLIDSIDVSSDGLTATIHFKQLFGGWLPWLTSAILPQHYMSTIPVKDAAKKSYPVSSAIANAVFSGPFVITAASSSEIDYAPNPHWNGGVSPNHQGKPYLANLKFQYFGDKNGEIAAFNSGAIDLAFDLQTDSYPAMKNVSSSIGTVEQDPLWEYEHLDIYQDPNHKRGNGLWDVNVRKAIAMAIDKAKIVSTDFPGANVTIACSPAPPGMWYHKDETCPAYDPAAAKAALEAAGYSLDSAGFMAKGGKEMNLELCTTSGNPTRLTELQIVEGDLKAIGVKSYIKTADAASVVFAGWTGTTPTTDCSIYRGNYDLADFAYVLTGSPYGDYFATYSSTEWPELGDHSGANDTRFKSAEMDSALSKLATDVSLTAQQTDAYAVQDAYVAGIPEIPLYYRGEVTGIGVHVGNWPGYNPSAQGPTWDVEDWFYKP